MPWAFPWSCSRLLPVLRLPGTGWVWRSLPIIVMATFSATPAAQPDDEVFDRLQIHGFASQSLVKTSDNQYFGDSPTTSWDYTEIAVNASYRAHSRVLLSTQVLARRAGEMYDGSPWLDYALVNIALSPDPRWDVQLHLGRFKNPLGLYNETRDVPFTRPGIFLPQIYYEKVRNLLLSSDGGAVTADSYQEFGHLLLEVGVGQAAIDDNVEWGFLLHDAPGVLKTNGLTWVGSLWYSPTNERLRLGLSGASVPMRFNPRPESHLSAGETDVLYWIASFQYDAERWTISAEYAQEPVRWQGYGPLLPEHR